ncbi:hypothetical protein BKA66DRAFT_287744 [Pyrenochaeta sp. MPI-SDFR-AT-0127]|nr:hypothetical protein BKA66DRAFT_287744 [Pyrenochaeta sp. MPI-SDFR-AT-0127]
MTILFPFSFVLLSQQGTYRAHQLHSSSLKRHDPMVQGPLEFKAAVRRFCKRTIGDFGNYISMGVLSMLNYQSLTTRASDPIFDRPFVCPESSPCSNRSVNVFRVHTLDAEACPQCARCLLNPSSFYCIASRALGNQKPRIPHSVFPYNYAEREMPFALQL